MVSRISIDAHAPLAFTSDDHNFTVQVRGEVVRKLISDAAYSYPQETGGVLIGRYDQSHQIAFVEKLAPQTPDSVRLRTSFIRGATKLVAFLKKLWKASEPRLHYLGEWHTHPCGSPDPSARDCKTMWSIANNRRTLCPEPILVILAGDFKKCVDIGVYIFPRGREELSLRPAEPGS